MVSCKVSETSDYHGRILETVIACICYLNFKIKHNFESSLQTPGVFCPPGCIGEAATR